MKSVAQIVRSSLCGTALHAIALCAVTGVAMFGATGVASAEEDAAAPDAEAIIVTGSRIPRIEYSGPNPVVAVTAAQIENSGDTNITDYLVRNPALLASIGSTQAAGQNTDVGLGATGVNLLDLRNLGTDRTLVLVNGKRHVSGLPETAAVDINSIPQELIDRVEVLTGGASAVYGADGVSGVVNFVLKRNFEGLVAKAQTGVTTYGDGRQTQFAVTAGKNFSEGRGNFALNYEYSDQKRVYGTARKFLGDNNSFYTIVRDPNDFPDDPAVFDRVPTNDTRWADSSIDGAIDLDMDGVPDFTGSGLVYDLGTYLPQSGGMTQGGSSTPRAGYYGDIMPASTKHSVNALFSYEFSPALRLYAEGKYVNVKALSVGQPGFDFYTILAQDNYYLNQRFGGNVVGDAYMSRDHFDLGVRGEKNDRTTWRGVVGFDGRLSDHAQYDISYVYGETKSNVLALNNRIEDRYYAALDAVDDGTGRVVCRIDLNPAGTIDPNNYDQAAKTFTPGANSGCAPLNLLGNGVASQAALDFILMDNASSSKVTQHVVSGHLSGDFGQFFELPGGPVGFAVGAEYREEKSVSTFDTFLRNDYVWDYGALLPTRGKFDVKELFAELAVPVLKNVPFAETLNFGAAVRLSDYSSIGTTTAWKFDATYAPIRDIRFRGTYSESVRAPNIGELYAAASGTFDFIDDPCDATNLGEGTQYRVANCTTLLSGLGLSPAQIAGFSPSTDAEASTSIEGTTGGNPNLTEETAKTWTAGVVLRPSFVPRLNITFDWYNIKLRGAVNTATAEDLAELCVDQPTLNNVFCPNITRDGTSGFIVGWTSGPQNVAQFATAGFDATVSYQFPIGKSVDVSTTVTVGYLDKLEYVPSIGADIDDDLGEQYKPRWTAAWDVNVDVGPVTASYSLTWFDKTRRYTTEQVRANPDIAAPQYLFFKARTEHDVRLAVDVADKFTLFGGVNNLTNSKPDYSLTYPVSPYGRYFYAGVKVKMGKLF